MITQKIIARTDSLKLDKIISRYGEDSMRQVVFIIVRPEPDSEELIPITIPEDAVGSFRILKPSGNFVIVPMSKSVLSSGETAFDVVLPASANTAKGSGYYDIRITSDTDKYYFTAQGEIIIDDNIISDDVLEDVSEVNGLVFPDDFLTIEDAGAVIDDTTTSTESTWSSSKISGEITEAIESIDLPPSREYSAVEKIVGKWFDQDLYAITYHDSYTSPGSGAHTTQHNLPGDVKLVEHNYIRYTYSGGVYMLIGNQMQQYLNISIPDEASPTYFNATQTVGNVDQTDIYYTIYYTKEV